MIPQADGTWLARVVDDEDQTLIERCLTHDEGLELLRRWPESQQPGLAVGEMVAALRDIKPSSG